MDSVGKERRRIHFKGMRMFSGKKSLKQSKMPEAIKVLIAKFKPPFLTIMGKLTYITILWQAICDHLGKKEHSACILFIPGIVIIGGTKRICQWPAFGRHDKVKVVRPVGCRQESVHIICPVELTEGEKY